MAGNVSRMTLLTCELPYNGYPDPSAMKFEGGPNIAIKIPPEKYDNTVHFYRNVLLMDVHEQTAEHSGVVRSHRVTFGTTVLSLDCVAGQAKVEICLEIRWSGQDDAVQFLEANGIEITAAPGELPDNPHWIRDPAGVTAFLKYGL